LDKPIHKIATTKTMIFPARFADLDRNGRNGICHESRYACSTRFRIRATIYERQRLPNALLLTAKIRPGAKMQHWLVERPSPYQS
jgi:hypothetical protein